MTARELSEYALKRWDGDVGVAAGHLRDLARAVLDEPDLSAELTELRGQLDYAHQMAAEMAHTADLRTAERDQLRTALRELVDSYTEWRVVLEDHDELIPWMRRSEVNDQMLVALSRATDLLPQAKPGAE